MKEKCAQLAFGMIEDGMTVGLGGGITISMIIDKIMIRENATDDLD